MLITASNRSLDISTPKVMGIVNVTPDSFSDGGTHNTVDAAFDFSAKLVSDGAAIIDVGGESTRPGASDVSEDEELNRVVPVVEKIAKNLDVFISVDTSKPKVMEESIKAGAHLINDIRALQEEGAIEVCAKYKIPVCLMHMQGEPRTMQVEPHYNDLLGDINQFFYERIHECLNKGIESNNIILDPGYGFGKTLDQNYELLGRLDTLKSFGKPLLVGVSRKSMIGNLLNVHVNERLAGSLSLALFAVNRGAKIVRVHDVKETVQALKCWIYAQKYVHSSPALSKIIPMHKKNKE
ncbi:MAG: dihydropteroate synthase [Succinivibrionaceae bacterium]